MIPKLCYSEVYMNIWHVRCSKLASWIFCWAVEDDRVDAGVPMFSDSCDLRPLPLTDLLVDVGVDEFSSTR